MSISSAPDRLSSPRRVQPRHLVGGLILAIGLIAVVVTIAISSTATRTNPQTVHPATISAAQSHSATRPMPAPVSSLPTGTSRYRVTGPLVAVGIPDRPVAAPGLGHR